ncbi:hypothetical protein EV426DRAFT_716655 [Tirmania nivea]|nr:hypothetical protein EV426DRAFT_716655 [Tirmania nivea]
MSASYINGLQEGGVGATIKHFVANEQETWRMTVDTIVEERHLRKLYPKPLVMSGWGGTNSTIESTKCVVDLEMPGPAKLWGEKRCAARVLHLVKRSGRLEEPLEVAIDTQEARDLIRQAGVEGITLLKNENNALPIGGDRSSSLKPYYLTTPYESIKTISSKEIVSAQGAQTDKWLPLASSVCTTPSGKPGVVLEFYKGDSFQGKPLVLQHRANMDLFLWDSVPVEVLPEYSFRSRLPRPKKELQGFGKLELDPGETKAVEIILNKYSVGYFDKSLKAWIAEECAFEAWVGASSADIKDIAGFEVKESFTWIF